VKLRRILTIIAIALVLTAVSLWIGRQAYSWLPPQASAESQLVDDLFSFLVTLGAFIFLGVTGVVIYSVLFHRVGRYDTSDGPPIEGNVTLEVVWTAIPFLLVFWIAFYSYQTYEKMAIKGPMEIAHLHLPMEMESAYAAPINETSEPIEKIDVTAKQWAWVFHYPEKDITSTELHLPVNRRVRLALRSQDVLHGFYIPAFRVKQDIIPQRTIDFEFTPIRPGKYRLRDSQYSGTYFAAMQTDVVVEPLEDYHKWLAASASREPSPAPNQAAAEYTFRDKVGWATIAPAEPPVVNYHP
jgi:cytochrome c oxidase subunit 2